MTSIVKNKAGLYKLLNLSLKCYDFAMLEKYQGYMHKTMLKMDFNVVKTFSVPYQELQLDTLVPHSTAIEQTDKIKIYERNIQMKNVLATKLPALIDLVIMTMPPGTTFSVEHHTPAHEDKIYFKDSELEKLKQELAELKSTVLIGE